MCVYMQMFLEQKWAFGSHVYARVCTTLLTTIF